jgi:hypothetical protein
MYCWNINGGYGLFCTKGVSSITWGLEKHSSCMLVKEQPATRAQEDLVSTCAQIKLNQFGMCDFCLSPRVIPSLRFWEPNTSSPSMWSTWVQNFAVLGIFAIESLSTLSFRSVGLNVRQPLVGVFPSPDHYLIDCPWDIDKISWPTWMLQ